MKNHLKQLAENYSMGFITAYEFISQYMEILSVMGAEKVLSDKLNDVCEPLAAHLMGIIAGSNKNIEDFNIKED